MRSAQDAADAKPEFAAPMLYGLTSIGQYLTARLERGPLPAW